MPDSLTGLMGFEAFLSQAGAEICSNKKPYLIAAADVGDFHYINTEYGYDIGDTVLYGIDGNFVFFAVDFKFILAHKIVIYEVIF